MKRKVNTRIQWEIPPDAIKELEEIMVHTGIRTKADLIEQAITLFKLSYNHRRLGREIGSFDESTDKIRLFVIPSLERVLPKI